MLDETIMKSRKITQKSLSLVVVLEFYQPTCIYLQSLCKKNSHSIFMPIFFVFLCGHPKILLLMQKAMKIQTGYVSHDKQVELSFQLSKMRFVNGINKPYLKCSIRCLLCKLIIKE